MKHIIWSYHVKVYQISAKYRATFIDITGMDYRIAKYTSFNAFSIIIRHHLRWMVNNIIPVNKNFSSLRNNDQLDLLSSILLSARGLSGWVGGLDVLSGFQVYIIFIKISTHYRHNMKAKTDGLEQNEQKHQCVQFIDKY